MTYKFIKRNLMFSMIILIFLLFTTGCKSRYVDAQGIHCWTSGIRTHRTGTIVYEVYSEPTKIIDEFSYWDKDNIVLNIKLGWDESRKNSLYPDSYSFRGYHELVTFAMYISWDPLCGGFFEYSDYKNPDDKMYIGEIDKDIFLSDVYRAEPGESRLFYKKKANFDEDNKGFDFKITSEIIDITLSGMYNNHGQFKLNLVPVFYDPDTRKYKVTFFGSRDGINVSISSEFIEDYLTHVHVII